MEIVKRADWGARYARGFGPAPLPARGVYLHHSVTPDAGVEASLKQDAASVRVIELVGQQRFGGGISYSFAVTPSGRVFEGHGIDRRGAHTKGCNSTHRAIVLVGDYAKRAPTQAQLTAVVALLEHGTAQDWWRAARLTGGHRDAPGAATSCPGDAAYSFIDDINRAAAAGEEDELSEQFEKDARARLLDGMKPGALAALERDLRGDLARKQTQLDRIEAQLARVLAALPKTTKEA